MLYNGRSNNLYLYSKKEKDFEYYQLLHKRKDYPFYLIIIIFTSNGDLTQPKIQSFIFEQVLTIVPHGKEGKRITIVILDPYAHPMMKLSEAVAPIPTMYS